MLSVALRANVYQLGLRPRFAQSARFAMFSRFCTASISFQFIFIQLFL
nr:MAG TPA: hypothetical protein [Caudoviricetes sp.]